MRRIMILLLAAAAPIGRASAGEGPCGLELGVWAFRPEACEFADPRVYDARYGEFERKFGDSEGVIFLTFKKGSIGLHQETVCGVRSAKLTGKECRIAVACKGEAPFAETLTISSPKTFTRAFPSWLKDANLRKRHPTLTYTHCARR
jgi:hypothetical protein